MRAWSELFARKSKAAAESRRLVEVGWVLDAEDALFIWDAPRPFRHTDPPTPHAKSARYCPAVLDYEARTFDVPCPIDLHVRFCYNNEGKPALLNVDGDQSAIRSSHLNKMLAMVPPKEWRHPDRPIIQLVTPYIFVADEPVWMNQMPPYLHYRDPPWPGVVIGGRLPIHIWPRNMMWAFEWHDIDKELQLSRGEPWFSLRFETEEPTRPVRLVEAEMTPALREYIQGMSGVANYVKRTFSLFDIGQSRRPATLLSKKRR